MDGIPCPSLEPGLASLAEQLILILVPSGAAKALFFTRRRDETMPPVSQESRILTRGPLPLFAGSLLLLQTVAAAVWSAASFGSRTSFPAAVFALFASILAMAVPSTIHYSPAAPAAHLLYLQTATLAYDMVITHHCFSLGKWSFASLCFAITVLKLGFLYNEFRRLQSGIDPRTREPTRDDSSEAWWWIAARRLLAAVSTPQENFSVSDVKDCSAMQDSEALFQSFMRCYNHSTSSMPLLITLIDV